MPAPSIENPKRSKKRAKERNQLVTTKNGSTATRVTNDYGSVSIRPGLASGSNQQHSGPPEVLEDRNWGIDRLLDWKFEGGQKLYLAQWSSVTLDNRYIHRPRGVNAYVMVGTTKWEIQKAMDPTTGTSVSVRWVDTWVPQRTIGADSHLIRDLETCSLRGGYRMSSAATKELLEILRKRIYANPTPGEDIFKAVRRRMKEILTPKMGKMKRLLALTQLRAVLPHGMYFDKGLSTTKRWILNNKNCRAVLVHATGTLQNEPCSECLKGGGAFVGCVVPLHANSISGGACACCYYAAKSMRCSLHRRNVSSPDSISASPILRPRNDRVNYTISDAGTFISHDVEEEAMSASYRPEITTPTTSPTPAIAQVHSRLKSAHEVLLGRASDRERSFGTSLADITPQSIATSHEDQLARPSRADTPDMTLFMDSVPRVTPADLATSSTVRADTVPVDQLRSSTLRADSDANDARMLGPSADSISPGQHLSGDSPSRIKTPAFKSINLKNAASTTANHNLHSGAKQNDKRNEEETKKRKKHKDKKNKEKQKAKDQATAVKPTNTSTHIVVDGQSKEAHETNAAHLSSKQTSIKTSGRVAKHNMDQPVAKNGPGMVLSSANTVPIGPRRSLQQPAIASSSRNPDNDQNSHRPTTLKRKLDPPPVSHSIKDVSLKPPPPPPPFFYNQREVRPRGASAFDPGVVEAAKRHKSNMAYPITRQPPSVSTNLYSVSSQYETPQSRMTPSYGKQPGWRHRGNTPGTRHRHNHSRHGSIRPWSFQPHFQAWPKQDTSRHTGQWIDLTVSPE